MVRLVVLLWVFAGAAAAEGVVALRTIRAQSTIGAEDIGLAPGADASAAAALVGLEARVTLFPGRPIHPGDVGPVAIVMRNQTVELLFLSGALAIQTEGRSLDRAAIGETVRVMNLASRTTVTGRVRPDGTVVVGSGR